MSEHTPGEWVCLESEPGYMATREEPGDPGCAASVYAETEHGDIPIATMDDPMYRVDPVDEYDSGFRSCGDADANARLIAAAPRLLAALEALRHADGCFCDAAFVMSGAIVRHSDECEAAQDAIAGVSLRHPMDRMW